jgi:glycine/D-amino acid oxidase-like deaminating enzyme
MAGASPPATAVESADTIVVGGGMVGAAIGYGLAKLGVAALILDEGDEAFRAARGNFGLVWVQTKGFGMQRYAEWTRESADLWPGFAEELRDGTAIDVGYEKPGGLILCLDEAEMEKAARMNAMMNQQAGAIGYDARMLDRAEVEALLPEARLGPDVIGASYCPHDGHTNPLYLLRGLHAGFLAAGGRYRPGHRVETIRREGGGFAIETGRGRFAASKIVLAAGHGIPDLAAQVGLRVPTRPERGQVLVTERLRRVLPMPMGSIRQTQEGTVMLGVSNEDVGFDDRTTADVTSAIAARACRILPELKSVRLLRTWGALRVLPPDRFPIYDESESHPGAFVATMHSGVTLAAVHARRLAHWIAEGETPPDFDRFSARRFRGEDEHAASPH